MTGPQILVVEDNEKNLKLFRDVLLATGHRTLEATTGGQAVELATEGDRERFRAAGFDGYLSKPVNIADLIATVRHYCERSR